MSPTELRRVLSGIRAAQSSVFCVVFCRPLFIILSFFAWPLHCMPFFDIWLPITLLASTNFSYMLTYTRTTILSQLSNLFHCSIYATFFVWVYSILMQVKTLFITLLSCMLLKWTVKRFELQFQKCYEKIGNLHKTQRSIQ